MGTNAAGTAGAGASASPVITPTEPASNTAQPTAADPNAAGAVGVKPKEAPPTRDELREAAVEMARELPEDGAAPPAAEEKKDGKKKPEAKGKDAKIEERVTDRLAKLTAENRRLARELAGKGKTQQETAAAEERARAKLREEIASDAPGAFKRLGVSFEDVVMAFAEEKGRQPTEAEKQELRLAALESDRAAREKAEKEAGEKARAEAAQRQQQAGFAEIKAMIDAEPERFELVKRVSENTPFYMTPPSQMTVTLVREAMVQNGLIDENGKLTADEKTVKEYALGALDLLEQEYGTLDLAKKPREGDKKNGQSEVKADRIIEVAKSKQRPKTISNSTPPGQRPVGDGVPRDAERKRAHFIELARRLPR